MPLTRKEQNECQKKKKKKKKGTPKAK